ncbi:MAG: polysulfide reductase NrfD, partial [Propionibacteriaceae bacterium]|nr:polysulfide reductase NrfD [Propionibacteriaceae bacterium]
MPNLTPTLQLTWSWLVVIYLFIAGVGAGAYLTSFWAGLRGWSERVVSVGRYLAAPLVIVGTGMLVFDLGAGKTDPLRIFGLFTHPSSMMSLGTWLLSIFIILAVIDGYSPLLGKIPRWRGKVPRFKWLSVVTAVFALCVAIYTSLLIGVVGAIPFWNSPILPVLFVVSALSTGLVATLAGAVIVSRKSADLSLGNFGPIHIGLLSIEMVVVFLFLFFAGMSHQAPVTFSF